MLLLTEQTTEIDTLRLVEIENKVANDTINQNQQKNTLLNEQMWLLLTEQIIQTDIKISLNWKELAIDAMNYKLTKNALLNEPMWSNSKNLSYRDCCQSLVISKRNFK